MCYINYMMFHLNLKPPVAKALKAYIALQLSHLCIVSKPVLTTIFILSFVIVL